MTYHYRTYKGWKRITWLWDDVLGGLSMVIFGLAVMTYQIKDGVPIPWTTQRAVEFLAGMGLSFVGHALVWIRQENKAYRNGAKLYMVQAVDIALLIFSIPIFIAAYL